MSWWPFWKPKPKPLVGVAVTVRKGTNTGDPIRGALVSLSWAGNTLRGFTNRDGSIALKLNLVPIDGGMIVVKPLEDAINSLENVKKLLAEMDLDLEIEKIRNDATGSELKIKKNFVPDVIYIDYLNICASARIKHGANVNSYTYIKAIAEELRGLAVEFDVPVVSATQTTRAGFTSSDLGLEDTSESFGLPATADFMFALVKQSETMADLNQIMVKQLKNRYGDPNINSKFVIGVDRSKMRLYDVEQSAQEDLLDGPVMDNTKFGEEDYERSLTKKKFNKGMFEGFK